MINEEKLIRAGFERMSSSALIDKCFLRRLKNGELRILHSFSSSTGFSPWSVQLKNESPLVIPVVAVLAPTLDIAWKRFQEDTKWYLENGKGQEGLLKECLEVEL